MARRSARVEKYYCPECGKKTLIPEHRYDYNYSGNFRVWACHNQPPKKYEKLIEAFNTGTPDDEIDSYDYWNYEARHGTAKDAERKKQREEVRAYLAKNRSCNLIIAKTGRDAEIADYGCVLDKLVRVGEPIRYHLLENNADIHARGFEVLLQTDVIDVVRLRDGNGVGIYLYWKMSWEPDYAGLTWDQSILTHTAASYISFRPAGGALIDGHPLPVIFRRSRVLLWAKDRSKNYAFKDAIFAGSLTAKKRKAILHWAQELERQLPSIVEDAASAVTSWTAWGKAAENELAAVSKAVYMSGFDAVHQNMKIDISAWITTEQAVAIAKILNPAEVEV